MWLGELLLLDAKDRVLVRAPFAATGTILDVSSAEVATTEACGAGVPVWFVVTYNGVEMVRGPASQVFQGSWLPAGCRVSFERFAFVSGGA